jgi:hypothetical protein
MTTLFTRLWTIVTRHIDKANQAYSLKQRNDDAALAPYTILCNGVDTKHRR